MKNERSRARTLGEVVRTVKTSFTEKAVVVFPTVSNEMTTKISAKKVAKAVGAKSLREGDSFTAEVNLGAKRSKDLKPKNLQELAGNDVAPEQSPVRRIPLADFPQNLDDYLG